MCESVVVRHYNKEKRGKLLKNMRFFLAAVGHMYERAFYPKQNTQEERE